MVKNINIQIKKYSLFFANIILSGGVFQWGGGNSKQQWFYFGLMLTMPYWKTWGDVFLVKLTSPVKSIQNMH